MRPGGVAAADQIGAAGAAGHPGHHERAEQHSVGQRAEQQMRTVLAEQGVGERPVAFQGVAGDHGQIMIGLPVAVPVVTTADRSEAGGPQLRDQRLPGAGPQLRIEIQRRGIRIDHLEAADLRGQVCLRDRPAQCPRTEQPDPRAAPAGSCGPVGEQAEPLESGDQHRQCGIGNPGLGGDLGAAAPAVQQPQRGTPVTWAGGGDQRPALGLDTDLQGAVAALQHREGGIETGCAGHATSLPCANRPWGSGTGVVHRKSDRIRTGPGSDVGAWKRPSGNRTPLAFPCERVDHLRASCTENYGLGPRASSRVGGRIDRRFPPVVDNAVDRVWTGCARAPVRCG